MNIGSQVKMTKGKKVIDNKKLKKQTSQKYPAKKSHNWIKDNQIKVMGVTKMSTKIGIIVVEVVVAL